MEAGQVVLVTGGGRGIGGAIARRFAAGGARVAVVARTGAEIEEVAAGIDPAGIRALAVPTDVTDEGQVRALFCRVVEKFGRLDVLVNSAGVCILGPVTEFRSEDWDYQMQVNVKGVFLCTREALKYMIPRGRGDIVNLASYTGLRGGATVSAYCSSKHAVVGFGRAVAEEVRKYGIRVTTVCPREVDTRMRRDLFPQADGSRWLRPEEVAEAVYFAATRPFLAGMEEIVVGLPQS